MINQQKSSGALHITLWIAQVLLASFFMLGALLKFQPIEKLSEMMPWTGQVAVWFVRFMGGIDVISAAGLILPVLLRIKPQLTVWAALGSIVLMLSAILFHVSRGETSVIGLNLFIIPIALFVAWGRFKKVPIPSRSQPAT